METILTILSELRPEFSYAESQNFIEDGYLDSLDIVVLVSELEKHYKILIDGMDILPENFISLQSIAELVRKSGGNA